MSFSVSWAWIFLSSQQKAFSTPKDLKNRPWTLYSLFSPAIHICLLPCKELSSPLLVCSSFLYSLLSSFLAQYRMAEFMQPSTFRRSCFILITLQVFIKGLPCDSTVLRAGNTTVNKTDRSPFCHWATFEGHQGRCLRWSAIWVEIWLTKRTVPRGEHLEEYSNQREQPNAKALRRERASAPCSPRKGRNLVSQSWGPVTRMWRPLTAARSLRWSHAK